MHISSPAAATAAASSRAAQCGYYYVNHYYNCYSYSYFDSNSHLLTVLVGEGPAGAQRQRLTATRQEAHHLE